MKHILLFGAGKSATVLIHFLQDLSLQKNWTVTVADSNKELLNEKVKETSLVNKVVVNIENADERQKQIAKADIVISMMPPQLHFLIAMDCILFKKNLLTASYLDEKIKALAPQIKDNDLLFLYEMGLDPGIDHMSAMEMINNIREQGGIITSFKSHCGGLIAPESDDNPWHYKISWNPKNVVNAGKAGATIKEDGEIKFIPYENLFNTENLVSISSDSLYAYYANRDSLSYMPLYNLEKVETFMRTTLRHPDFFIGWKNLIDLKLTTDDEKVDTTNLTIRDFFKQHLHAHGYDDWMNNLIMKTMTSSKEMLNNIQVMMRNMEEEGITEKDISNEEIITVDKEGNLNSVNATQAAANIAMQMHQSKTSFKQLLFLGIGDDETLINKGICTVAEILQFILEKKLALNTNDKDLIIMLHEIEYSISQKKYYIRALLQIEGKNSSETAMATTVGLPLGIAAQLILEGNIKVKGLQIPIIEEIYKPVLHQLQQHQIIFEEENFELTKN